MPDSLLFVRRKIARIEGRTALAGKQEKRFAPTGHSMIDQVLGGGLLRGHLHELLADPDETGSGSGFAAILARILGGDLLWLIEESALRQVGALNAQGLAAMGINPARLIIAVLGDAAMVLRAAADGLRCPALGSVVMILAGDPPAFDLTASRRLMLAAEQSGVTALILRLGGRAAPNAAQTRWQIGAAPSLPLAANAPGHPVWDVRLLRQRGQSDRGHWRVEWNLEDGRLRNWQEDDEATISGPVAALSGNRPPAANTYLRRAG